jgi:hypothetical protein
MDTGQVSIIILLHDKFRRGHAIVKFVALCYKPEGLSSIPDEVTGFSN